MQQKYFRSQQIPNISRPVWPQRALKNILRANKKSASQMRYVGKRFSFHKTRKKSEHLIKNKREKGLLSIFYMILIKDIGFQKVVGAINVSLCCCIDRSLNGFPWLAVLSSLGFYNVLKMPLLTKSSIFWLWVSVVNKRVLFTSIFKIPKLLSFKLPIYCFKDWH